MIYVERSVAKGRGVHTDRALAPGDVIERAPVIVVPASQRGLIAATILDAFVFEWGEAGEQVAVALGFGSLYNHSPSPNAHYLRDLGRCTIEFVCVAAIAEGEEIVINYHGNRADPAPIVFEGETWKAEGG